MTQFGGSFRFVQLPAVTQLLADLRSTGRLCVAHQEWTGEIVVREGQIVGARLGAEHGRAALEAIAAALPDAEFSFTDEPVSETSEVLIPPAERAAYMERLGAEHQRLAKLIASLGLVPRLVSESDGKCADTQVTIGAAALQLIPALVFGHTLERIARERGLVRTLRDVASLMAGGLVTLEPQPTVDQTRIGDTPLPAKPVRDTQVLDKPLPDKPLPDKPVLDKPVLDKPVPDKPVLDKPVLDKPVLDRPVLDKPVLDRPVLDKPVGEKPAPVLPFAARPAAARTSAAAAVRSVAVASEESTLPSGAFRLVPARMSVARHSTSSTVSAQPPALIPPGVAARLSAALDFAIEPETPAPFVLPTRVHFAGWRKAIVSFFLTDQPGD